MFVPENGESQHDLRHYNFRLPAVRFEYKNLVKIKYQMHHRLREFTYAFHPQLYPIVYNYMDALSQSLDYT